MSAFVEAYPVGFKISNILTITLVLFQKFFPYNTVAYQQNDTKLILAHALCRHGDRNPKPYPNDPWRSEKYWPPGYDQLTEEGQQQLYNLGQYLRTRYAQLIRSDKPAADQIYVESTEFSRVIRSAQACVAGLFSSKEFDLKSIPVHVIPPEEDYTLSLEKPCNRFDCLQIEYEKTPAYTKLFENNKQLIEYLEKNSGMKLDTLTSIYELHDTFFVERLRNYSLPSWAEDVMNPDDEFKNLSLQFYVMYTPTNDMKRLQSGYLLKEMLGHFSDEVNTNASTNRTLWMYFAHDLSIANMLNSLGLFELHVPPYASCIFFELYENETSPFVQVFYRNTTTTNVPPLEIPNCGTKCPLNKFYKLYDDILPKKSIDEECALLEGEQLPPGGNPEPSAP